MKRKILSAIVAIIGLIILFLLIRTLVHTFTSKPKVSAPAKTETTITAPQTSSTSTSAPKSVAVTPNPATSAPTSSTSSAAGTSAATNPVNGKTATGTSSSNLASTGPNDVAMVVLATAATAGTMVLVRRRQLAQL